MLFWLLFPTLLHATVNGEPSEKKTQCGENTAPAGIFIDERGIPELLCETPVCFFTSDRNKGAFRNSAKCSDEFKPTVCKGESEWTGGLIDINNGTHRVLKTECCEYETLAAGQRSRRVLLKAGESFRGGSVMASRQIAHFDIVKEVRKLVSAHNRVKYEVTIQRMPCRGPNYNKLRDVADMHDDEYYVYEDDSKSADYVASAKRYRQSLRRKYDRMKVPSSRRRFQRPRIFGLRHEQLFPLQNDDYYFYDDMVAVYPRRGRYGKPVYGRPRTRTFAGATFDGVVDGRTENNFQRSNERTNNGLSTAFYDNANEVGLILAAPAEASTLAPPVQQQAASANPTAVEQSQYAQAPSAVPSYATANSDTQGCGSCPPTSLSSSSSRNTGNAYHIAQQSAPNSYRAFGYDTYGSQYSGNPYSYSGYGGRAGDLNSAFGSLQCFSGEMTVLTPSGAKLIKDLKVGDMVLSIQESFVSYSPVVMHLHKTDSELASFNRIVTEDGYELELTDYHLIYHSKCGEHSAKSIKLVHTHKLREGQCVYIVPTGDSHLKPSKVTQITKIEKNGIYAPLTASGDILVNNVLASCHSNMAAQTLQQTFFSWWRAINRVFVPVSQQSSQSDDHDLPLGVSYLTSVIDLLLPTSFFL